LHHIEESIGLTTGSTDLKGSKDFSSDLMIIDGGALSDELSLLRAFAYPLPNEADSLE